MRPIPTSLKIGPYTYTVRIFRESPLRDEQGRLLFGEIDHMTHEIKLSAMPSLERIWASLFHEAMHGILANAGIWKTDEKVELEQVIEVLGTGTIALLIDNGLLAGGETGGDPDSQTKAETSAVGDGRDL
ncbi:MAG: hypothetical protein IMX00_04295 [Limnochordales bacterium]|nr:hypothetical protein [Limnochordales bacterium]